MLTMGFPSGSVVKNLPAIAGDAGLISGLGGSHGEGSGNLLQYCCLGNSWKEEPGRLVHGVAKESDTTERLNTKNTVRTQHSFPHPADTRPTLWGGTQALYPPPSRVMRPREGVPADPEEEQEVGPDLPLLSTVPCPLSCESGGTLCKPKTSGRKGRFHGPHCIGLHSHGLREMRPQPGPQDQNSVDGEQVCRDSGGKECFHGGTSLR